MATLILLLLWSAQASDKSPFPEGKGRELVEQTCTKCHSEKLVLQNHLDRAGWDRMIVRMQEKNGLWELEPAARKEILDYLETHLSMKTFDPMDGLGPRAANPLPIVP